MTERVMPEGKYVDIGDELRIHYHDVCQGEPVLFLHGSGPGASGYSNFKGNFPYFAERGFRGLVPDLIGYGYSSKPENVDYTLGFLKDGIVRFLDALKVDRCSVVGNSQGGAVAILLGLDHPERVSRLVLMAPGGLEEREVYMQMEGIQAMIKAFFRKEGVTRDGMREVFGLQLYDSSLVTDQTIEERFEVAKLQPKQVMSTSRVPNLSSRLSELSMPIFALWGVNDKFCPVSGAMTLAQQCRSARVTILTECGHWVMVEHAERFNRWCEEFLREESS